jgi:hypothetical protein
MSIIELDPESTAYLAELAKQENTPPEALIKSLIYHRWVSLQTDKTFVERRGGHPQHLLQDAPENLSERSNRKQAIADYLKQKHPQQFLSSQQKQAELVNLIQSWIEEDDSEEQKETGEYLIQALAEDRLSDRKLFPLEMKGVT